MHVAKTAMMEVFAEIGNVINPVTIVAKSSTVEVCITFFDASRKCYEDQKMNIFAQSPRAQDINWIIVFWTTYVRSIYVLCLGGILVVVNFLRSFQGSWTLRSFLMIVSSGVILPLCFLRIASLASLNAASMAFYSIFIVIVSRRDGSRFGTICTI